MLGMYGLRSPLMDAEGGSGGDGGKPDPVAELTKQVEALTGRIVGISKAVDAASKHDPLATLAEIGLLEKTDSGYVPKAGKPKPKDGKPEDDADPPWKAEMTALKRQLTERDEQIDNITKAQTVQAALAKAGALRPERDAVHLMGSVIKSADGKFVVKGRGKYEEEVDIPVEDYAANWLKDNPELAKATAAGGSGTPGGGGHATGGNGAKTIPFEQWNDQNFYRANIAKFDSGEYVRGARLAR